MKNIIRITAVFALSVICIPALSLNGKSQYAGAQNKENRITEKEICITETTDKSDNKKEYFSVLDTESGQVSDISARDYIIGAVCAEMPASFNEEALKAQAVASHTYALYQIQNSRNDESLKGADFSDDPSKYQAFFSDEEIRKYYGDKYDEYYQKVAAAVDSVYDQILVYNDEPIVAAFHSISSGMTESAENVWGTELDYLVPCDSSSDIDAPGYTEEYCFTADELRSRISAVYEDIEFPSDFRKWFSDIQTSESGTVLNIKAGNTALSGAEMRDILTLRSSAFEIAYSGDSKFCITTRGYGHGVGMSQFGANYLASQGQNYTQILDHYYKGATVKTV